MTRTALLVAASLLVAACSGGASDLDGTSWDFVAFDDLAGVVAKVPTTSATIAFEGDRVTGSDGCNTFNGSYEISSGNRIAFGPLASTLKACEPEVMAQAVTMLEILQDAILFEKADGQLYFRTEDARYLQYRESAGDE